MNLSVNDRIPEKTEYRCSNDTGDAHITVYHLFPGIEVAFVSVHMADFDFGLTEKGFRNQYVGIHYCKEGRIEQEVNREFFYLMPGDCSVVIQDKQEKLFQLPLRHYHGISIRINLDISGNPIEEYLKFCGLAPHDVAKELCGEQFHVVLRSSGKIRNFFDELYDVDAEQRFAYLKVKLPELFYYMRHSESGSDKQDHNMVPRTQVDLVKRAAEYISQNINQKITVKKLTMEFGVSDTYLQNSFRSVYGMPVISFIRAQKMQSAAQVLIHTNRSVDEIAEEFGYENESKFSAAFRKIMGDTPSVYRKEHSKVMII